MSIHLTLYYNLYIFSIQSPLSLPPLGQTVAGQIVLLGDLCLNANSKGSFINSCAVPAPGGFSSAGASGLTQGSYDWNGSLRPVLQKRQPLQTPVPQSSPPHRASCRAGNPIKTIAAGTVCRGIPGLQQGSPIKELVWKEAQYKQQQQHLPRKGKPREWDSGSQDSSCAVSCAQVDRRNLFHCHWVSHHASLLHR